MYRRTAHTFYRCRDRIAKLIYSGHGTFGFQVAFIRQEHRVMNLIYRKGVRLEVVHETVTHNIEIFCALDISEEHTSELQSRENVVCRLLLERKKMMRDRLGIS